MRTSWSRGPLLKMPCFEVSWVAEASEDGLKDTDISLSTVVGDANGGRIENTRHLRARQVNSNAYHLGAVPCLNGPLFVQKGKLVVNTSPADPMLEDLEGNYQYLQYERIKDYDKIE